jgi:hypothetical protein
VLEDLRPRFDDVLAALEAAAGWRTSRVQRPVAILGRLDAIMTGIRQLRRTRPLEVETVQGLRVPTLPEMARIKAWLLATRHTTRDYLDTVVLLYEGLCAVASYPLEWLARLADHIPDPGRHRTHFYAHYANRVRGERPHEGEPCHTAEPPPRRRCSSSWARASASHTSRRGLRRTAALAAREG